jgi:hypothetical protein
LGEHLTAVPPEHVVEEVEPVPLVGRDQPDELAPTELAEQVVPGVRVQRRD